MERSRLYKNKDKDSEELRRRRIDQSVELRKVKKDEQLQKRRNIMCGDEDETSPLKERQVETPERVNYDSLIRDMQSSSVPVRLRAVQRCRKTLSHAKNPPIDELHRRGAVDILCDCLVSPSDELVFEAAWALTNIASGDSTHTSAVVKSGAVPKLISLLTHPVIDIAEQCVWALGNIAGEGADFRDMLVDAGVVEPVISFLERAWTKPSVVCNIAWMLSNLCRNRNPPPRRTVILRILPVLNKLLQFEGSDNVIADTAWALSYVSDAANEFIDEILESGCLLHLLRLLASNSTNLISPALRTIGNLVIGNDVQTQAVLDAGLLPYVPALLSNEKSTVVKETCWMLSNITAGNVDQVQMVIDHNIIPCVLQLLHSAEFRIQKEACWVISNLINSGSATQCAYLLNQQVLSAICNLLNVSDARVVIMVLDSLRKLLEVSEQYGQLEPLCIEMETCGGLDKLEQLQDHSNDQIYQNAYDLIEKYFNDVENEQGDSVTAADTSTSVAKNVTEATGDNEFVFVAPESQLGQTTDFQF